jgi:hypothetical protein
MSEKDSPPTVAGAAPELPRHRSGWTHRIPSWPINAIGTPELGKLNEPPRRLPSDPFSFSRNVLLSRNVMSERHTAQSSAPQSSNKTLLSARISSVSKDSAKRLRTLLTTKCKHHAKRSVNTYVLESIQIKARR